MDNNFRYIVLDSEQKVPTEKLRDGGRSWEDAKDFATLGVLIKEPFIVLDFDTEQDAKIITRIIEDLDLKCRVMQTTRGVHVWFKSPKPWKNSIKTRLFIGIHADIRSWGKLCYTRIKQDGKMREWIRSTPYDEIEEIPKWLYPKHYTADDFKSMTEGSGRNQALFNYILTLQTAGFTKEEVIDTISIINNYVFPDPLSDSELEVILRDESFKSEDEVTDLIAESFFDDEGKFLHHKFAELLVSKLNIVTLHGLMYIYQDGYYQPSETAIEQEMIKLFPTSMRRHRAETLDYLRILTTVESSDINTDPYVINLINGRLDLRTHELLPHTPDKIDFVRVPVEYDPKAKCQTLDHTISRVFQHDEELENLFDEAMGYTLIKNCRYRKGFLFLGGGANGKSTILNMIRAFVGMDNCSFLEMDKLSNRFSTAELEHKLVNIGDDINQKTIGDTGTLKKLFTGEVVTVERKNQHPFALQSHAKLLFSANQMPRIMDKSYGLYSRLAIIPFNARFTPNDPDFDPFIEHKLTTPTALSALLNRALRGLTRLFKQNHFTEPRVVELELMKFQAENSTVLYWISEEEIDLDYLLNHTTHELYNEFNEWCVNSGVKYEVSLRAFHNEIESSFELKRKRGRHRNDYTIQNVWYFYPTKTKPNWVKIRPKTSST